MSSSWENTDSCGEKVSCEFQDNLDMLRQIPFFAALPLEALKVLAYLCVRESFKTGEYLFHEGDSDGQAFYIISGNAILIREKNGKSRDLATYGPGRFLGGLALLAEMRRLFSLRVGSDFVCLVLTREKFAKVLEQFPHVMPKILEATVDSVSDWEERFLREHADECEVCATSLGVTLV